jgi:alpha-D-ribose 1-methylphosphonate 5-triphosphate synthase subunit PhnG
MGVLARSNADVLERHLAGLEPAPSFAAVRPPETGLVMLRGRAGGDGAPFNVGEMTVTRCVVKTEGGPLGFGYVQGRSSRHAELAAKFDALLQQPRWHGFVMTAVIEPLADEQARRRARRWNEAARTKVDFFTVVRGEG